MTILTSTAELTELGQGQFRHDINIAPLFFQRNGVWRRIQNKVDLSGDPNFSIGADEHMQFRVRSDLRGNAPLIHIGYKGEHVRIKPLDTNDVDGIVAGNAITFPEAWNNADLRIVAGGHVIKKEIVLRQGHPTSFRFRVDDKTYTDKLEMREPYLQKDFLRVPLNWVHTTNPNGKEILKVILPSGDWSGWTLDPTFTSQPDGTAGLDVYMDSGAATTNFNAAGLNVGEFNVFSGRYTRTLIKFDLSSIPTNATITDATFSMMASSDYSDNARVYTMYRCLRLWSETGCTHNKYDGTNNWSVPGCGDSTNDYNSTSHGSRSYTATETLNAFKDFTMVASEFQKFVDLTYTNYGWLIMAATELNDAYAHYDSEDATAGNRPKIVSNYTVPPASSGGFYRKLR